MEDKKIEDYKKLIREHGTKKALEMLRESGIIYEEDFTEMHKHDPIFSSPISSLINSSSFEGIMTTKINAISTSIGRIRMSRDSKIELNSYSTHVEFPIISLDSFGTGSSESITENQHIQAR